MVILNEVLPSLARHVVTEGRHVCCANPAADHAFVRDSQLRAADLVRPLEHLPGFRDVLVHEYVALELQRAVEALDELDPIERFVEIVRGLEGGTAPGP